MSVWLANIVKLLHIAFIAWMVWAPFWGPVEMLVLHAAVVPTLLIHWATGTDGCALTVLEKKLRGISEDSHSFIWNIVHPVYDIPDAQVKLGVTILTVVLWAVTLWKLHRIGFRKALQLAFQPPNRQAEKTPTTTA